MARAVKFLIAILLLISPVAAQEVTSLVTPQDVSFDICSKTYTIPSERLFYLSIASAAANKFSVDEIQSKTGYILFTAANKQYLASVIKVDASHTQLRITPTNNNYYFAPGIVLNFFKYIDLNANSPLVSIPKL